MDVKERVREIVENALENEEHFLVDVKVGHGRGDTQISIILDGDNGISIKDCATVSRKLGDQMEEEDLISSKYSLTVSSFGVGELLVLNRQYKKNIGRKISVITESGDKKVGELLKVDKNQIVILEETKDKKKKVLKETEILFNEIVKTKIEVTF